MVYCRVGLKSFITGSSQYSVKELAEKGNLVVPDVQYIRNDVSVVSYSDNFYFS